MDMEEAVALAIATAELRSPVDENDPDGAHFVLDMVPFVTNRHRWLARAAIKAVESYRVPEFRKEGGG
jgi:hypothetical protein